MPTALAPISRSEIEADIRKRQASVAHDLTPIAPSDIISDFELFRPHWENGYFESDLGAGEMIAEGATTLLGGVYDFGKKTNEFTRGRLLKLFIAAQRPNLAKHMKVFSDEEKALGLQTTAELGLGYEAIGHGAKRIWGRMKYEDLSEKDAESAWEYWKAMTRIEEDRAQGAKLLSFTAMGKALLSDEFREKMQRNEIEVDESAALGGAMIFDPVNWAGFGTAALSMRSNRAFLTGAQKALLNDQARMVAARSRWERLAKQGQTNKIRNSATKKTEDLTQKITANEGKIKNLTKERYGALDGFAQGLPEGSALRNYWDDMLKTVDDPSKATIGARGTSLLLNAAGGMAERAGSSMKFLLDMPPELLKTHLIKAWGVSEANAEQWLARGGGRIMSRGALAGGLTMLLGDQDAEVSGMIGLGAAFAPHLLMRGGRDLSVYGRQLALAESTLPYFKRVASMRPERLTDQLIDRSGYGATLRTLGSRSFAPKTIEGQVFKTGERIGPMAHKIATGMEKTGLGRWGERLGRTAEATVKGAAIPAGIGLVAAGGEEQGFYAGLGMGLVFGFAGGAFGEWGHYKNPGVMRTMQYGDLKFYRDTWLGEGEIPLFDSLSRDGQLSVATFANRYPDVVMRFARKGRDGHPGNEWVEDGVSHIELNVDSPYYTKHLMAHEISHHMEVHGMRDMVHELILGNVYADKPGVFTLRDKSGKPITIGEEGNPANPLRYKTNEAFEVFRNMYHRRFYGKELGKLSPEEQKKLIDFKKKAFPDERIASELFAEHGADYLLFSPQRFKALYDGPFKKMGMVMRDMFQNTPLLKNVPFLKNAIASMGGSFRDGKVHGTGLFGKFDEVPGLRKLIQTHDRKMAGLDPETMRKRFPIPEEEDTVIFSAEDISKNPELANMLTSGTVFRVNKKTGEPIVGQLMSPTEAKQYNQKFSDALKAIIHRKGEENLPKGHLNVKETVSGAERWEGTFISEEIINELAEIGGWNKEQISLLKEVSRIMERGEGDEYLWHYFKATSRGSKRVYTGFRGQWRAEVPYALEITKDGNINFRVMDVDRLNRNIEWLFKMKKYSDDLTKAWGPDKVVAKEQFKEDLLTYGRQQAEGIRYMDGDLHPDKENYLHAVFGKGGAEGVRRNPVLADFPKEGARMAVWSSRRLERIGKVQRIGGKRPVNYERIQDMYMPREEQTVPLPFIEDLGGEDAAAGMRRVYTDTMRKGEYEKFMKGITEKEKWDAIGNQSQLQPFMPRFPKRGEGKQYMPAERTLGLKDNITEDVLPSITQAKLSPQQLQAALAKTAGAKSYADEIGLTDFVKDRKSITKDEVEAYVRENSPKLEVEVLGEATFNKELNIWQHQFDRLPSGEPKFSEYQEPGGTNYREVKVKLPIKEGEATFNDPHFGDNVLLHLRVNDRIDANGKKVYFIEELQSTLHQRGRKEGYGHREWNKGDLVAKRTKVGTWSITIRGARVIAVEAKTKSEAIDVAWKRLQEGESELHPMDEVTFDEGKGVPDAPFKKNWPALGLKYAVKQAIEGGYDRVAWLDGEGQAARYDLSKKISKIDYSEGKRLFGGDLQSELRAYDHDGKLAIKRTGVTHEQLPDIIGKEAAEKMLAKKPEELPWGDGTAKHYTLEGIDLKVGGEGMKAFYDREMRSLASKISKKIKGGKVEREVRSDLGGKMTRRQQEAGTTGEFGSHGFDVPKDPAAVDSLRLYMPADRAPTDARPPSLMMERGEKGRGARPMVAGRDEGAVTITEKMFMPAAQRSYKGPPPKPLHTTRKRPVKPGRGDPGEVIAVEFTPGATHGAMAGVRKGSMKVRQEWHDRHVDVLIDPETSEFLPARELGLVSRTRTFDSAYWNSEGVLETNPVLIVELLNGERGDARLISNVIGMYGLQEAVAGYKRTYGRTKANLDGAYVTIGDGRPMTHVEHRKVQQYVADNFSKGLAADMAIFPHKNGFDWKWLGFNEEGWSHKNGKDAVGFALDDAVYKVTGEKWDFGEFKIGETLYEENHWQRNPNGEAYRANAKDLIQGKGRHFQSTATQRSNLQARMDSEFSPGIRGIHKDFEGRGFGKSGAEGLRQELRLPTPSETTGKKGHTFPTIKIHRQPLPGETAFPKESQKWSPEQWSEYLERGKSADEMQRNMPDAGANPEAFSRIMGNRLEGIKEVETPSFPTRLGEWVRNPEKLLDFVKRGIKTDPEFFHRAKAGIKSVREMHEIARRGELSNEAVSLSYFWGFLSRMLDPYNQEAGWLRMINHPQFLKQMWKSIDGKFNLERGTYWTGQKVVEDGFFKGDWKRLAKKSKDKAISEAHRRNLAQRDTWVGMVSNIMKFQDQRGALTAGRNAIQNINASHSMFQKWNGKWDELTSILNNPELTGPQMREMMWEKGFGGAGMQDKVSSFVIATLARGDVLIMDRWQYVNFWFNELAESVRGKRVELEATWKKHSMDFKEAKGKKGSAEKRRVAEQGMKDARKELEEYREWGNSPLRFDRAGTPEDRTGFYDAVGSEVKDAASHALYRTLENYFDKLSGDVSQIDPVLADFNDAFSLHWLTWNMIKREAVGHSSLDVITEFSKLSKFPKTKSERDKFLREFIEQEKYTEREVPLGKVRPSVAGRRQLPKKTERFSAQYGRPRVTVSP